MMPSRARTGSSGSAGQAFQHLHLAVDARADAGEYDVLALVTELLGDGEFELSMIGVGDIIAADLRVLFVAINPPPSAADGRAPFATPTNGFWPLLHAAGLTPRLFLPSEAERLLDERLGLVSMVQRSTAAASELRAKELRAGAKRLSAIVEQWHPRTIALLGVTLLPFVLPAHDEPGPGLKRSAFHGASVFVLPNPSGRNLAFPGVAGKLPWYRALASSA